jgi:hypothetical protein
MGSRQSNTSWCWSPRKRSPEHVPPAKKKTADDLLEESYEEKLFKEWWELNRWRYVEPKVYDHTDNDYNT